MLKRALLPLLLLSTACASAAELTEMETRWLQAGFAVPAAQRPLMIEAMVAHEIGHCWRYTQGVWHAVPAGFEQAPATPPSAQATQLRDTRREEGFADLVALAWTQQRHPEHYASVAAWMRSVRAPSPSAGSHSTVAWLQLAPTGAVFAPGVSVFEQANQLWRVGLQQEP